MADLRDKSQAKAVEIGGIAFESPELLNELIQNNEKILKELEELNIKKENISVSEDGKIQISNKALLEKVKKGGLVELFLPDDSSISAGTFLGKNLLCGCGNPISKGDLITFLQNPKVNVFKNSAKILK